MNFGMVNINKLIINIRSVLSDNLRQKPYRGNDNLSAGYCYIFCEALYHLTGKTLKPHYVKFCSVSHWFLKDNDGNVIDPTVSQFYIPVPYHEGIGKGFLTKQPSKRTKEILRRLKVSV